MIKQAFAQFTDSHLTVIGFLLFVGVFTGAILWTFFIQRKSFYNSLSKLPFSEGDSNGQ